MSSLILFLAMVSPIQVQTPVQKLESVQANPVQNHVLARRPVRRGFRALRGSCRNGSCG